MKASVGDTIVIRGHHTGQPMRRCQVVEARSEEGPFLVRWEDGDHETLFSPGSDATVEPARPTARRRSGTRSR